MSNFELLQQGGGVLIGTVDVPVILNNYISHKYIIIFEKSR